MAFWHATEKMIGCKMTSVFDQAALIVMQLMKAKKGEIKASKKALILSCFDR
jgi:hypothetical protein